MWGRKEVKKQELVKSRKVVILRSDVAITEGRCYLTYAMPQANAHLQVHTDATAAEYWHVGGERHKLLKLEECKM
ncbi:hypothetical protein E2C01_019387 [Portunus trituberculatus]|uniref:Uncharacterized protein n=1 Tax=Portunus trituberculatus TaxID=210409 RepID=A0A5B7DXG1_PORTR|nr:hypothetical protein [Portunus trituberculatus]